MLIDSARSTLVIIDVQEKLCPVMDDPRLVLFNGVRLLKGAAELAVPVVITEQYPAGIGPTMIDLREAAPADCYVEKTTFSSANCPAFMERLQATGRKQAVVCGTETHVCVLQTALGLLREGYEVFVVRDACSSRQPASIEAALARMAHAGCHIVTTEMVLFEWLQNCTRPEFKPVLSLIK